MCNHVVVLYCGPFVFLYLAKWIFLLLGWSIDTSTLIDVFIFQGCAIGIGFSAGTNLDQVLNKLEQVSKNEMTKKSSGILSFMKVNQRTATQIYAWYRP